MKTLIFFFALILFSCEKDSECWTCQTRTVKTYITVQSDITTSVSLCDKTVQDIFNYENENTKSFIEPTLTITGRYINMNVEMVTKCKK